ncbi:redoxin family protein [Candidatus Woesearchaeota archaeon]|jgi:thiol-disulfide isomerase/thioredoxin|nr:redoxin family protein [Candidatus Woesearchaeota archaeon]MBT4376204.1 redoxin family protein [archaeon]MBT4805740.1 redoxin family protein [Candidatus Woesearchaeota archaeon]MBT5343118.1 redoxin family protein [Candidatus Woesearchaeota archaeon]MBT6774979.1 redoxin family protein [Candidatus Woesearchaeota archaeon]
MLKKINFMILLIIIVLFLVGCTSVETDSGKEIETEEMSEKEMENIAMEKQEQLEEALENVGACDDWKCEDLVDVLTGETYQIKDFEGKIILVESFAVWCPTCLKQQLKMKDLLESDGDSIVHISLDTDPNEEASLVKEHAEKNGLNWKFSVSPIEITKKMIDEFGIGVVNAPSAPVILVCEDQSTRLLEKGVKSAEELKGEIAKGC